MLVARDTRVLHWPCGCSAMQEAAEGFAVLVCSYHEPLLRTITPWHHGEGDYQQSGERVQGERVQTEVRSAPAAVE